MLLLLLVLENRDSEHEHEHEHEQEHDTKMLADALAGIASLLARCFLHAEREGYFGPVRMAGAVAHTFRRPLRGLLMETRPTSPGYAALHRGLRAATAPQLMRAVDGG